MTCRQAYEQEKIYSDLRTENSALKVELEAVKAELEVVKFNLEAEEIGVNNNRKALAWLAEEHASLHRVSGYIPPYTDTRYWISKALNEGNK